MEVEELKKMLTAEIHKTKKEREDYWKHYFPHVHEEKQSFFMKKYPGVFEERDRLLEQQRKIQEGLGLVRPAFLPEPFR